MPDPTKQTVSATESPALFNVSPYCTRWMLWQSFAKNMALDIEPNSRMRWGRLLQPLIIEQAAADLKFEVRPNADDNYVRGGVLGCTRDAEIICPDRGPGALETKCVFDYRTWMTDWGGGDFAPKHYEIQLQQQMLVGDGTKPYEWGVLAAWVAGDVHYFERKPILKLWEELAAAATAFLADVRELREPDPFGVPIEVPWLNALFPTERGKSIDLSDDAELAEVAVQYRDAKAQEAAGSRAAAPLRARLLAAAKDAEEIMLAEGIRFRVRPHGEGKRVTVYDPRVPLDLMAAG